MKDELKNDNWDENIPGHYEENSNFPESNENDISINPDRDDLDIAHREWDNDYVEKSNLPDFGYDVNPPESDN